jgi:hypothetical protein
MLYTVQGKQRLLGAPVRVSSPSLILCMVCYHTKSYLWCSSSASAVFRFTYQAHKRSAFS